MTVDAIGPVGDECGWCDGWSAVLLPMPMRRGSFNVKLLILTNGHVTDGGINPLNGGVEDLNLAEGRVQVMPSAKAGRHVVLAYLEVPWHDRPV